MILSLYENGFTVGVAPEKNNHKRAKRGKCVGWSSTASRNNKLFLFGVDYDRLNDVSMPIGWSFTLTLKICPETAKDWSVLRDTFLKRLKRLGLYRYHWLTEWQERGVPHMHGCLWFENSKIQRFTIMDVWLSVAAKYEPSILGQDSKPIENGLMWSKYLAKHADRGKDNYQRCNPPAGWINESVGRVWGKGGDWPESEPSRICGDQKTLHAFRRIIKNWRISTSRGTSREKYARRLFVTNKENKNLSHIMGLSEWLPKDKLIKIISFLQDQGYTFE